MQKLINDVWVDCEESDLVVGEQYRRAVGGGGWQQQAYVEPKTVLPITNVVISGATLKGNLYWVKKNSSAILTADGNLPDGELMLIVEKVVSAGEVVVDDTRAVATILEGKLSATVDFPSAGNWLITADRLNKGLAYIGSPIELSFDSIEFDVHSSKQ